MRVDVKVLGLFNVMVSYAKQIYEDLYSLCELEKAGKKSEKVYYNTLSHLNNLLIEEANLYRKNIDFIINNSGDLTFLVTKNSNPDDKKKIDLLCVFNKQAIYERIKSKLCLYISVKQIFNDDLFNNWKFENYDYKPISESFLDESFLNDIQKVSLHYMTISHLQKERKIDYKYLTALIFNIDKELVDNYFEISKTNIFLSSPLTYTLNGLYKETFIYDEKDFLKRYFNKYVNYIVNEAFSLDDDNDYKVELALNYLKSILDLFPISMKNDFYNNFMMEFNNDEEVPLDIRKMISDNIRKSGKGRRLLKQINLGESDNWLN